MGTYTQVVITKRTVPRKKMDELVDFLEEEMVHEGAGIDTDGYFISFSGRKWGRNRWNQKTKLANKLNEIFEDTKRQHWGSKNFQVFKRFEGSDKFVTWNWKEEVEE